MKLKIPFVVSLILTIILLTISMRVFNTFNPYLGLFLFALTGWFFIKQFINFLKTNHEKF